MEEFGSCSGQHEMQTIRMRTLGVTLLGEAKREARRTHLRRQPLKSAVSPLCEA
jgi:hypothetical protein